ncbi:S-adenosyl-L-methionine-dependent methyltransferase [Apiospora sp. TS-2023a]
MDFHSQGQMTKLLQEVQKFTTEYLDFFSKQSLPEPSFEHGNGASQGADIPSEVHVTREKALEATEELHRLLLGPIGVLMSAPADQYLLLSLQYIYRYNIAEHVPLHGTATFGAISEATGLDIADVTRFIRLATGWHVFHEVVKGTIVHTETSRQLVGDTRLKAWIENIAEEFWPSLARTVDSTQRWPGSQEPTESGYSLGHNTRDNPFDVIKRDPVRQQRFNDVQSFSHRHVSFSLEYLMDVYDFSPVRTLVDVGGCRGEVAIALALRYPNLEIVVQDQPDNIRKMNEQLPSAIKDRVRGMEHDFLTPQPVKGADVYFLRWVMHDWSDKYCIKILKSLVPGLKRGARIVVNDICIPEAGQLGVRADRGFRQMDISMKAFNNARERDAGAWVQLFASADHNLEFVGVTVPSGARMAIIEAKWTGCDQ